MLDKTDKRLLFELDSNSRTPLVELGKKLKLLPETVSYKLQRLHANGILKGSYAVINGARLGYMHHKVFIRLQNATEREIESIIRFSAALPSVMRVIRFDGEFDLDVVVKVVGVKEFDDCISAITGRFFKFIRHRSVAMNVWARYFPRNYLAERSRKENFHRGYDSSGSVIEIDRLDRFLLEQLAANSRVSGAELERMLEQSDGLPVLSSVALLQRIKRLEKNGIITGYAARIESSKMGQNAYKVVLYLNARSGQEIDLFEDYCSAHMNVVHLIKTIGRWDYELDVEFPSKADLRFFLSELSKKFPQLVRDYTTLDYLSVHKYSFI